MPVIAKLVATVVFVFVFIPLGIVAGATLLFPLSRAGERITRARREILMTAIAVGGTVLLAGTVSIAYALMVGLTCLAVVAGTLISELIKGYRVSAEQASGAAIVVPRPRDPM